MKRTYRPHQKSDDKIKGILLAAATIVMFFGMVGWWIYEAIRVI